MSSGIDTPPLPPPETPVALPPSETDAIIQRRIRETGRQVQWVEIADGLILLAIGVLVYFLAVAVVDHWLIVGGLGFWGRLVLWLVLLGAAGAFVIVRLLPPLVRRINPLWAAATIERSRPSLKNGLMNFLLFRRRRTDVAPLVYRAMERRAAEDLMEMEPGEAVDRTGVIRLGYVLAGVLAVFCLYLVLSPKSPIRSAARVLWPWAEVAAPTRVTIRDVQPGDTTAFYGDLVTVSAELSGLEDDEQVVAVYSTADGQTVDQAVPMMLPAGDYRYECRLPPDREGLQQDLTYWLAAGDCRSRQFRILARVAPSIAVEKVLYHYPPYTGMADRVVERQGDLRAIEGTEVTIHAEANTEITPGTAEIDLGCTGRPGPRMTTEGRSAVGNFFLGPEYDVYQLCFTDLQDRRNTPIPHRIEVLRDLPPEAELVEPKAKDTSVPIDGALDVRVQAKDPDFGLRRVVLRVQRGKEDLSVPPLLDREKPEPALSGPFAATYRFEPSRLRLKVGERVAYWVEAEDNREPNPGTGLSDKQWIEIVGGGAMQEDRQENETADVERPETGADQSAKAPPTDESANGDQPGDQTASDQQGKGDSQKDGTGENGDDQSSPDQKNQTGQGDQGSRGDGGESKQRIDPDAAPGDAMQQILDDRLQEQQQQQQKSQPSESGGQDSEGRSSEESGQAGQQGGEKGPSDERDEQGEKGEKGVKGSQGMEAGQQDGAGESGGKNDAGQKDGRQGEEEKQSDQQGGTEQGQAGKSNGEKTNEGTGRSPTTTEKGEAGQAEKKTSEEETGEGTDGGRSADQQSEPDQSRAGRPGEEQTGQAENGRERPDQQPKAGRNVGEKTGSPKPSGFSRPTEKKPEREAQSSEQRENEEAQSPSTSEKQSDSQGETAGDRSGGGPQGGGQKADQPGVGGEGSQQPDEQSGSQAAEPGEGKTGDRAGAEGTANGPTGSAEKTRTDEADDGRQGEATGQQTMGETPTGEATQQPQGTVPGGGGQPDGKSNAATPTEPAAPQADQANLEYARRQSILALEHLREQLAKEKPELLEQLGWSKDDARRFLRRWESMQQAATQQGPEAARAREEYQNALRSLGLRPRGTQLRHGGLETDATQNLRDSGRFAPPSDWAEQFREYTRGIADGEKNDR